MARQPWWRNSRGEWFVIIQVFLVALVALAPGLDPVRLDLPGGGRAMGIVIGVALGVLGLAVVLSGFVALGSNLTPLPHPKDDATLVQTGIYALVRHPLYSGVVIGAVGWALINVSLLTLLLAVVLFVFFDIKSRREERWLVHKFPEYAAYRQHVHKLIPFVY